MTTTATVPRLRHEPITRVEEAPYDRYPRVFTGKSLDAYTPREVGIEGENLATHHLELKGYEVIERNWRCHWGEADIIALDDDVVVLVEVKTRIDLDADFDLIPELAVDSAKERRYGLIALAYLMEHPGLYSVRFDVIAVSLISDDHARLRHMLSAFVWED